MARRKGSDMLLGLIALVMICGVLAFGVSILRVEDKISDAEDSETTSNDSTEISVAKYGFTLDSILFYYEDGMTWGEFVESDYNTGNYFSVDPETLQIVITNDTSRAVYTSTGIQVLQSSTFYIYESYQAVTE